MQLPEVVDRVTADEPPLGRSVDEIVSAGRKAERSRRAGFAAAGAAGLLAVVAAGAFAMPPHHAGPDTGAAAAESAPFSVTFARPWPSTGSRSSRRPARPPSSATR